MNQEWTPRQVAQTLGQWLQMSAAIGFGILIGAMSGPFWLLLAFPAAAVVSLVLILVAKLRAAQGETK